MDDDYTVVVTDRSSGKVMRSGFPTLEQAERVANVLHQSSDFHVTIEVTRPPDVPQPEADMDGMYSVVVTNYENAGSLRYEFSTLEQAKRAAREWQTRVAGNSRVEIVRNLPGPSVVADRRRIDWIEVDAVIATVMIIIASVVVIIFVNPVAWDALVKFASRPFIVGNAVGLAVTAAGIAAARHLHNRSR